MPHYVLDASALLTLLHQEPGSDKVVQAIEDGAAISTVNLAEVASKLNDLGAPEMVIQDAINALELTIVDFSAELAYKVGVLRPLTKHIGLSLGDRNSLNANDKTADARSLGRWGSHSGSPPPRQ